MHDWDSHTVSMRSTHTDSMSTHPQLLYSQSALLGIAASPSSSHTHTGRLLNLGQPSLKTLLGATHTSTAEICAHLHETDSGMETERVYVT